MPPRPPPAGDHVRVTVSGYGLSSPAEGVIDFGAGEVRRAGSRPPWRPEGVAAPPLASALAAAEALHQMGDRSIRASQFTLGEVCFQTTLDGQTHTVRYTDEGGPMEEPLHTLWRLAICGP